MEKKLANYHTHTYRCNHAQGAEEDYVCRAIEAGYAVLGFSDHTPWPVPHPDSPRVRMSLDQLDGYVHGVRQAASRHADEIRVLVGLECDYDAKRVNWLRECVEAYRLDYLILGHHADYDTPGGTYFYACKTPDGVLEYAEQATRAMETGLFAYLAHPDIVMHVYPAFDDACRRAAERLCRVSVETGVPLEYNLLGVRRHAQDWGNGFLGYPCEGFWRIAAEIGCKAILGMDAHTPEQLLDTHMFDEARAHLNQMGIEVLPRLPGPEEKKI